ncbi:FAD-dependent oxidoreductase [Xanthomarina sp. GH4-25]|uniref:glycerol-3-phosphate dehydrogenase/oxidase n=1 Tax=Xanthomarina sp. GH4-25 TaxID=3349335 RepID=UPI0038781B18
MKIKPFSILNRADQIKTLTSQKFDLVIIGGGVTGAGIALDAASRGMKTCLIEKNDFASGTSNKSTKLIHGGLRYLKQLEIGLVKESGRERAIVHKLAPHLVIPEKMLLPLVEGGTYGKMMTSIGLKVYDLLASVEGDDRRKMLNKRETLEKEPLLDTKTILGSGYYSEYRTDDARLTIELLKKAAEFGATILNYCEMQTFVYNTKKRIKSIACIDLNSDEIINISSRNFVSATGPWVDVLREKDASRNNKHLHLTKGVHLVFPFEKFPLKQSIYFDVSDGRMIFAIPRGRVTYVGTTDTDYFGDLEHVVATKADATYLIDAVNEAFPKVQLTKADVESNWAGLRPLIHEDEKDPSELSRKDEIFISNSGLISIAGGKLTGYRKMAHRVIDTVIKTMTTKQASKFKESYTEKIALTTPTIVSSKEIKSYQKKLQQKLKKVGIEDAYFSWYLTSTYGKQADVILKKMPDFRNKNAELRLIRSELWYGIHHEMVNSLADFFVRRTGRLYFNISSISKFKEAIIKDCTKYLSWDATRINKERIDLNMLLKDATHFYNKE